jgi:uncharacterized repeat protein (TIGR03803 family)
MDFTNLYSFTGPPWNGSPFAIINTDGAHPEAGLILSSNILYGTAEYGGSSGSGTIFAVDTNGPVFANLYNFTSPDPTYHTNSDGACPSARLFLSGNTLYGTAEFGGSGGNGTVFAVNTDGTGFTNLHSFTATSCFGCPNSDGANPYAGVILLGNTLYGTVLRGGISGNGTVFAVNTDGTGFTSLYNFTATSISPSGVYTNSDGANPAAGLILSSSTLYGTTYSGGSWSGGTVFSLSLPVPPKLSIIPSGANVILTWPTNAIGFRLQSTTNFVSSVWTTNFPAPVVVSGQNTVTNLIFGTQQFFRLSE